METSKHQETTEIVTESSLSETQEQMPETEHPAKEKKKTPPVVKSRDERLELKMKLIKHPMSIVLAPKTKEGYALMHLTMITDKIVWLLRKKSGIDIPPERLEAYIDRINGVINQFYSFSGGSFLMERTDQNEDKLALARLNHSMVLIPRTSEGKTLAYCTRRIDPLIIQAKAMDNMDLLKGKLLRLSRIALDLDTMLKNICDEVKDKMTRFEKKRFYYVPTWHIRKLVSLAENQDHDQEGQLEDKTD